MNAHRPLVLVAAVATLLSLPFAAGAAERRPLPAPAAGDLAIRGALVTNAPAVDADRTPVSISWALPADAPWSGEAAPFVAESREHWLRVPAADLERGVDPAITSAGAIVRLSPLASRRGETAGAIDPARIEISAANGAVRRGTEAASTLAGEAELLEAGAAFPAGTVALRLRDELGSGPFRLRLDGAAAGGAAGYLLHVHEPASAIVLALGADRSAYASGESGTIAFDLSEAGRLLAVDDEIIGLLVSPAGRTETLRFAATQDGRFSAPFAARGESGARGLWQVEVAVTSGLDADGGRVRSATHAAGVTRRTARTAFAIALPTAALAGELRLDTRRIAVPVEVASPGRYTARATLAQRDDAGRAIAVARAESSAWLEAGEGELELVFDAASLAGARSWAPLELVELELADPGRMGLLERRALAVELAPDR